MDRTELASETYKLRKQLLSYVTVIRRPHSSGRDPRAHTRSAHPSKSRNLLLSFPRFDTTDLAPWVELAAVGEGKCA
jgi:hypothetical protein